MSRTKGVNSHVRDPDDFYATPVSCTKAIVSRLPVKGATVLDPGAGTGSISKVVGAHGGRPVMVESHAGRASEAGAVQRRYPSSMLITADFLADSWRRDLAVRFDLVIGNPPFKLAAEFARRSLREVKDGGRVALLLNMGFLGSCATRRDLLERGSGLVEILRLPGRPSFCAVVRCSRCGGEWRRDPKEGHHPLTGCENQGFDASKKRGVSVTTSDQASYGWLVWERGVVGGRPVTDWAWELLDG